MGYRQDSTDNQTRITVWPSPLKDGIILYGINPLYEYNIHNDGLITLRTLSAKVVKETENSIPRYIIIFDEEGNPERREMLNTKFWDLNKGKFRIYSMDNDTDVMIAKIKDYYNKRARELERLAVSAKEKADPLHFEENII